MVTEELIAAQSRTKIGPCPLWLELQAYFTVLGRSAMVQCKNKHFSPEAEEQSGIVLAASSNLLDASSLQPLDLLTMFPLCGDQMPVLEA